MQHLITVAFSCLEEDESACRHLRFLDGTPVDTMLWYTKKEKKIPEPAEISRCPCPPAVSLLFVGLFSGVFGCKLFTLWKTGKSLRAEDTNQSVSVPLKLLLWVHFWNACQGEPCDRRAACQQLCTTVSDTVQLALKEQHPPKLPQTPVAPRFVFRGDIIWIPHWHVFLFKLLILF